MGRYFGTDGVRGIANQELTPKLAYDIGAALAYSLERHWGRKPKACVGMDTRISGGMLECALSSGFCACGGDIYLLGVMPTPSVAFLTKEEDMDAGIVISASHNPFEHNGIKIFGGSGYKLDDDQEAEIEDLMDQLPAEALKHGAEIGRVIDLRAEGTDRYVSHILSCAGGTAEGIRVLIDCANGAASDTAKQIFTAIKADCDFMSYQPDGVNINNKCGSTHMEELCRRVKEGGYDLGIAFDGDADRCLMCDENGKLIDGDDILGLLAAHMKENGQLSRGVVATIMSNMGLSAYLKTYGIDLTAVKVGDRHVLEEMRRSDCNIGGEQSGHVILSDCATTGDGQLTAVKFLMMLKEKGVKASVLAGSIFHYPQVVINLEVPNRFKKLVSGLDEVKKIEHQVSEAFGGDGRMIIRPSGTEAIVRIMVEGKDGDTVEKMSRHAKEAVSGAVKGLMMKSSDY
ncbi:MAG: phosphoglucosamine mutase [Clostridiaceae bacterium]|nr:phosphoglucosamine mutase [Clostridiaceae bacterium]